MSRPLRIQLQDGLYHVTARGDRREPIFVDDVDRARLLEVLALGLLRFDASLYAYCMMGNHYHLVVHTRQANLSRLMRHVNGVYSQAFNRRHGIVGHLFQGRFKAIHVDRDEYLIEVCRYVELNPVRARIVDRAAAWKWSSYRAHVGLDPGEIWLETEAIHALMLRREAASDDDLARARSLYAQLVLDGLDDRLWEHAIRREIYLGGEAFIDRIQQRMSAAQASCREIPSQQSGRGEIAGAGRPPFKSREALMLSAYRDGGRSLASIADQWGLSVSRVSRLIKRAESHGEKAPDRPASGERLPGKT